MRQAINGGKCHDCGDNRPTGLFWANLVKVLDLGIGSPMEPDTTQPVRCDSCECKASRKRIADGR